MPQIPVYLERRKHGGSSSALCGPNQSTSFAQGQLESSFLTNYNQENATKKRRGRHPSIVLSTLNPNELLPSDFIDISNKFRVYIAFATIPFPYRKERPKLVFTTAFRFPDHTRGFLYIHRPSTDPLQFSIRLRCTASNDPATFDQGKDLMRFNLPWELSVPTILRARFSYFQDYLLKAGILTADQISDGKNPGKCRPPARPREHSCVVSTLISEKLLPSDFVDLSSKRISRFRFRDIPIVHSHHSAVVFYHANAEFPAGTRGFLHLHKPLDLPLLASSIRFRCTPSNDPASFDQGEDLRDPSGWPWDINMSSILSMKSPQIRDYLLHAGIMTESQMSQCRRILHGKRMHSRLALHRFDQPFLVNFGSCIVFLMAVVNDFVGPIFLRKIFCDNRPIKRSLRSHQYYAPYTGSSPQHLVVNHY